MDQLPATQYKNAFLELLNFHQFLIVIRETGCGKSTQVPQWCAEHLLNQKGRVGCTQPRRIAATKSCKEVEVADEMNVELGTKVGYSIRFDSYQTPRTKLLYCTDGLLLRHAWTDKKLEQYSCIIIDEAYERTLSTDILMGYLKEMVIPKRPDLKVVIMSATLKAEKFQQFFNCPVLKMEGRCHQVKIFYAPAPLPSYVTTAVDTVFQIHMQEAPGNILIFLPGKEEIEKVCALIRKRAELLPPGYSSLICAPLYSALPLKEQEKAITHEPQDDPNEPIIRKCVVATNIAETSLTIEGIVYVIDSGLSRQKIYNTKTELILYWCNQSRVRAGRTAPGKCYRLFTQDAFKNKLAAHSTPEILRTNLRPLVLSLLALGIDDVFNFDYMDSPDAETMRKAFEMLIYLGAIDASGKITRHGSLLAKFPLDPILAKALCASVDLKCSNEVLSIISMLSVTNCFAVPDEKHVLANAEKRWLKFRHKSGDHLTLLNIYNAFKQNNDCSNWCHANFLKDYVLKAANQVRMQLVDIMDSCKIPIETCAYDSTKFYENSIKALVAGLFMQIAHRKISGQYVTTKTKATANIDKMSALVQSASQWVLYHDLVLTKNNYLRIVSEVRPEWLSQMAPSFLRSRNF